MSRQKFFGILVLSMILSAIAGYYIYKKKMNLSLSLYCDRNHIIKSNYNFIYEHWKEEKLSQLRNQETYSSIIAETQLGYFLQLCNWVHQQLNWATPDPYPLSNALDILANIRAKKTGGFCGQYAYVFADVLKSLGFFAVRYIELWSDSGQSHFSIELWSDQFEKWIMLDPDQSLYYELNNSGIPANAYEIRESLLNPAIQVNEKPVNPLTPIQHHVKRDVYMNFAVSLRSDLLRHTKPLTVQDRFDMFLFFQDQKTKAVAFKQFNGIIPYRLITTRKEDIYYDCNRVRVEYKMDSPSRNIILKFFTDQSMANFKEFIVSSDHGKTWIPSSYQYLIYRRSNTQEIWIMPVNMYGRKGIITKVFIHY